MIKSLTWILGEEVC